MSPELIEHLWDLRAYHAAHVVTIDALLAMVGV